MTELEGVSCDYGDPPCELNAGHLGHHEHRPSHTITVRVGELEPMRTFLFSLRVLEDDMRVGGSPFAERLGNILDRWVRAS